jgi:hypothetical protein
MKISQPARRFRRSPPCSPSSHTNHCFGPYSQKLAIKCIYCGKTRFDILREQRKPNEH